MPRYTIRPRSGRRPGHHGTTAVEVAVVMPIYITFVFTVIGFGHLFMINNMLDVACRSAARLGSTTGVSTSDVRVRAQNLYSTVVDPASVSLIVKDAGIYDDTALPTLPSSSAELDALPNIEVSNAQPRDLFLVKAEVNYNDVAIVSMPFLEGIVLRGYSFARHE